MAQGGEYVTADIVSACKINRRSGPHRDRHLDVVAGAWRRHSCDGGICSSRVARKSSGARSPPSWSSCKPMLTIVSGFCWILFSECGCLCGPCCWWWLEWHCHRVVLRTVSISSRIIWWTCRTDRSPFDV